ncbi:MAG TPA: hypothetical protein VGA60_01985 [Kiloniellales bacterium]|jgi:hypothetical protein
MKGLDPGTAPIGGAPGTAALPGQATGDYFPARLAEAIDILADRARRHGLVEVVHLLDVAAMAARDVAVETTGKDSQA